VTDDHRCEPLFDAAGHLIAHALVSPDLDERGRAALLNVVEAARRLVAEQDAADPEGAADRDARYPAGQERIRERNQRLREQAA